MSTLWTLRMNDSASRHNSKAMVSLLEEQGISIPTPVQKEIIPSIMAGRDVLAQSETGSGKTLSFAIPIIEQVTRRDGLCALVLVPTRELRLPRAHFLVVFQYLLAYNATYPKSSSSGFLFGTRGHSEFVRGPQPSPSLAGSRTARRRFKRERAWLEISLRRDSL